MDVTIIPITVVAPTNTSVEVSLSVDKYGSDEFGADGSFNVPRYGDLELAPGGLPPASKVYAGTDRGDGVLGTLHASNIATAAGGGSNLSAADLKSGVVVDDVTGTYVGGGGNSYGWMW